MTRKVGMILAILLSFLCATTVEATGGDHTVRFVDDTGAPVSGVLVEFGFYVVPPGGAIQVESGVHQQTTGADGTATHRYHFAPVGAVTLYMKYVAPPCDSDKIVEGLPDSGYAGYDFGDVNPCPATNKIEIEFVDPWGNPVPGVEVELGYKFDPPEFAGIQVFSDANGIASHEFGDIDLPFTRREAYVQFTRPNCPEEEMVQDIPAGDPPTDVDFGVVVFLPCIMQNIKLEDAFGLAVTGAAVTFGFSSGPPEFDDVSATTDGAGVASYSFGNPSGGTPAGTGVARALTSTSPPSPVIAFVKYTPPNCPVPEEISLDIGYADVDYGTVEYIPCSAPPSQAPVTPSPTCDSTRRGHCGGEPHIARWTRPRDTFHGECDLVLVHSEMFHRGAGFDLHVRTTSESYYSYVEMAAVRFGHHILEVHKEQVFLDGGRHTIDSIGEEALDLTSDDGFYQYKFELLEKKLDKIVYKLDLGDESSMEFRIFKHFMTVSIDGHPNDLSDAVGLLGNYTDGSMWDRNGDEFHQSFEDYAFEWQFDPSKDMSLFLESRDPQLPYERCRMPSMPRPSRRHLRVDVNLYNEAKEACIDANAIGSDLDICIDDVMTTGELGLVEIW